MFTVSAFFTFCNRGRYSATSQLQTPDFFPNWGEKHSQFCGEKKKRLKLLFNLYSSLFYISIFPSPDWQNKLLYTFSANLKSRAALDNCRGTEFSITINVPNLPSNRVKFSQFQRLGPLPNFPEKSPDIYITPACSLCNFYINCLLTVN